MLTKLKNNLNLPSIEFIGSGEFDVDQEFDEFIEELEIGFSLKDDLLYIYYSNLPGREYFIYKWPHGKKVFYNLIDYLTVTGPELVDLFLSLIEKESAVSNLKETKNDT